MDWLEALGSLSPEKAAALLISSLASGVVAAVLKAKAAAKEKERRMQRVPPSDPPALPSDAELLAENERLRLALRRAEWRIDEAERAAHDLAEDQTRTAAALSAERAARAADFEQLRHYRAYVRELEDRARAMDSGFTRLDVPGPFTSLPPRVVEVDDRPTPPHGRPAFREWLKSKRR